MKAFIVLGSARPVRNTPVVGRAVAEIARKTLKNAEIETVDLRDWPLPFDAEEQMPALGQYTSSQVKAWSDKVKQASGFIFVSPEYNRGYPAALKNALDALFKEWHGKPAVVVTFGGRGGDGSSRQLGEILKALRMDVVETRPQLKVDIKDVEALLGELADVERAVEKLGALMG